MAMKQFEMRMQYSRFRDAEAALIAAGELVPARFRDTKTWHYFWDSLSYFHLELAFELLEELTVNHETEFGEHFWKHLGNAAKWTGQEDESAYCQYWEEKAKRLRRTS